MKAKYWSVCFIIFISGLFFSCNNASKKYALKQLDTLTVSLQNAEKTLEKIDVKRASEVYGNFQNTLKELNACIPDEKDENWNLITDYSMIKSGLKKVTSEYEVLKQGIQARQKQVEALRHDIRKKLIPADSVEFYLRREKLFCRELVNSVDLLAERNISGLKRFDSLQPIMLNLIQQYKEKKTGKK